MKEMSMSMPAHLTPSQRSELAALLQSRLQEIERQSTVHQEGLSLVEHAQQVLQQDGDDAPQRAGDRELDFAVSERDGQQLVALRRAQSRLNDADFGRCIDCGVHIPFERMRIEPEALRCVACESTHERKL
jgi:RNA polymerase-binding transcription factor DksA